MFFRCILLVALLLRFGIFAQAMPTSNEEYSDIKDVLTEGEVDTLEEADPQIDEIANREYETVHDRILAVNMAHWNRKRTLKQQNNDTNLFDNIEKDNEAFKDYLYQGDIQMDEELERELHMPVRTRTKRNAVRRKKVLWTSRVIPYYIPGFMWHIRKNFMIAIQEFHSKTCIRFVPYQSGVHRNYITFGNDDGCSSMIGKKYHKPGKQTISLGRGCNHPGTIIHEILHALGFFHEQARSDRDKFVKINWQNILADRTDQFDKYSWKDIDDLGVNYDYKSIMHYGRKAFTNNGQPTIVAIDNQALKFGNDRLSVVDAIEINALYDCKVKRKGWASWSEYTPCDDKCYKSRQRFCYNSGNRKSCGGNVNYYGIENQERKCTKMECLARNARNGNWGHWSSWSACSVKCDDGVHRRTRQCNNPRRSKYGKPCAGSSKEEKVCSARRCHPGPDDTDFDDPSNPMGMWSNKPGWNQLKWVRHQGFTKTMNTGPMRDHTTGKGYYLYMESSGRRINEKAILVSKVLKPKQGGQCLKFYYTMFGKTMGFLKVQVTQNGVPKNTLFFRRGDQGRDWIFGTANLKNIQGGFKLEFIANVGGRGYSDIAIDDVYIDDGECDCQDKYVSCRKWSANEGCQGSKVFMTKNCKRSCHVCGNLPGETPVEVKKCEDLKKVQCPLWAKKGECSKSKEYMNKNCAKSCKICEAKCEDSDKVQCPLWAKKGECYKNKIYMHKNCAKSCKLCELLCDDTEKFKKECAKWAAAGECLKNEDFMDTHCRRSCNKCSCKDTKPKCRKWAKEGECKRNPQYMTLHCRKACRVC